MANLDNRGKSAHEYVKAGARLANSVIKKNTEHKLYLVIAAWNGYRAFVP